MSDKISNLLTSYFGIDISLYTAHFEVIINDGGERYAAIKKEYERNLKEHPSREHTAKKLYVDDEFILHIQAIFLNSEIDELSPESKLYYPICTHDEIRRIEKVASAEDYLLKLRADYAAGDPRIARLFFKRRDDFKGDWSLTSYYDSYDFEEYINKLSKEKSELCRDCVAGYATSRDPHGLCINTQFGKVIVLSESLRHFLYYMNAFLMGPSDDWTDDDWSTCLFIAVRTMLLTETPDFDLDPRGALPSSIDQYCNRVVDDQIQFIIGHEYSHLLLDHFGAQAGFSSADEVLGVKPHNPTEKYFTPRQQQEFEADAGSILHADYSDEECASILNGAVLFFLFLDIFYSVSDYINPPFNPSKTHPDPIDRLWALRSNVFKFRAISSTNLFSDEEVCDWINSANAIKERLTGELLPFGIEHFEMYGSNYFPTFRKKILFDRFDY